MRIAREVALYNQGGIQNGIDGAEDRASKVATSFITRVSESEGIKVHNADDLNDYIQINSNGVDLVNDNVSIANFGESARVGKEASSRFMINADSLEAYDDTNAKYFEVSPNGMTYGVHTVADTAYADGKASDAQSAAISAAASDATSKANAAQSAAEATAAADATAKANTAQANAEKVATNFITTDSTGIKVHNTNDSSNYTHIGSSGMDVRVGGDSVAEFGSTARIGLASGDHVNIGTSAVEYYNNNTRYARFGGWSHIGDEEGIHLKASSSGLQFAGSTGREVFDVSLPGSSTTRKVTDKFGTASCTLESTPVSGTTITVRCKDSSDNVAIQTFTAGTSATKTYSKGTMSFTLTYTANTRTIAISGSNSPKVDWVKYDTTFPNLYATIGIRSYGDEETDPSAAGLFSLTQGLQNRASGETSAALNYGTVADGDYQTVVGKFNVPDTSAKFIVGSGSSESSRGNALVVGSTGDLHARGDLYRYSSNDGSGGQLLSPVFKFTASSVSSLPKDIQAPGVITADMEVIHSVLSNPSAQTGDWTVTTSAGSLTISGSISGTTNITLYLAVPI